MSSAQQESRSPVGVLPKERRGGSTGGRTARGIVHGMTVVDDLVAEQDRLEDILGRLDEAEWMSASGAAGWTIADVVLHLAQSEESVVATASGGDLRTGLGAGAEGTVDERVAELVRSERAAPEAVFARWRRARLTAADALRAADPDRPLAWVAGPVKPATLATTRLTEHWAHGLDITGPLGVGFPDTDRLRHVAWLAHRTLPYALTLVGEAPVAVRCELTAPDGGSVWSFGPADAESSITGPAGEFCRVAVRRLAPDRARLVVTGRHGGTALRAMRTYAELSRPGAVWWATSQARVDGLGFQGKDGEDAFVDAPEGLATGGAVEGFQAEGVLAQGKGALAGHGALAEAGEVDGLGVVGAVDEAQVVAAADLQARLRQGTAVGEVGKVGGGLDDHALSPGGG